MIPFRKFMLNEVVEEHSKTEGFLLEDDARAENRGLKAEDEMLKKHAHLEPGGKSSGRGSDAFVTHRSGGRFGVEIKTKGSAKGQTKFSRSPRGGWGYHGNDTFAQALNNHIGKTNARRHLHGVYGTPLKGSDSHEHVHRVHQKRGGELHLKLGGSTQHMADLIHGGMNHNDIYHDDTHGSYALTDHAAKTTGLPHIRDHIDTEAARNGDFLSVRHRVKSHGKGKKSTTAQLNINKKYLRKSTHDITTMGKDFKRAPKKGTRKA